MPDLSQTNLLLINLSLAALLTGLIWTVQLVHYPGFMDVGPGEYLHYQRNHMRSISILVMPLMLAELGFTAMLQYQHLSQPIHWSVTLCSVLLLVIWLTTFFISSPLHAKLLADGYNPTHISRLVNTNWVRTLAWTGRFLIYFLLLLKKT
ncbi:MAG: hypothetical protein ACLFUB_05600 [Cyclobacteriaceae bacterium]